MLWLVGKDALRSDDPKLVAAVAAASPNPNLETAVHPTAAASMHRVTGTFADPTHESNFAAQLFRMAYPTHVLLMVLVLAVFAWNALVQPDMRTYWAVLVLCVAVPGLACRMLLHRTGRQDPVRSQRMGSWAWTLLTALGFAIHTVGYLVAPAAKCAAFRQAKYMVPFMMLLTIMITGTHGVSSACKFALMAIFLTNFIVGIATCHDPELDPWFICTMGILVLGSAATHTAELYLRRSYADKVQAKMQEATRERQLEERNEQLQAEKERLLYDMQRRGRPLDDDVDDRSAIRRGLLAGSSQREFKWTLYPPTDPSKAGGPTPSDSPPPSLPLGPPSSSDESVASPSSLVGVGRGFADVPTRGETELAAARLADIATTWRADEAEHDACMVQVENPAACGSTPPHTMPTPEQALEEACHCIQSAHTNTDWAHEVARTLAIALGAKRAELGTVKALHAVLLQVMWPTMENAEVCTATGASMSTFCKWRGPVHQLVRLHCATVPPSSSVRSAIRRGLQAGASQLHQPAGDADLSGEDGPAPSSAPTPTLPPGAPSSTTSGSAAPPLTETDDDIEWCAESAAGPRQTQAEGGAPLPAAWNEAKTSDGRTYYFHTVTRETKWTRPAAAAAASEKPPLPAGWKHAEAPNGRTYYYLPGGNGTQWVRPTEPVEAAAATPATSPGEEQVAPSQFELEAAEEGADEAGDRKHAGQKTRRPEVAKEQQQQQQQQQQQYKQQYMQQYEEQQYEEHLNFNAEEEAILVDLMDEESVLELQSILGSTDSFSPRQQALRVARQDMHMQIRPNNIERFRILHAPQRAAAAAPLTSEEARQQAQAEGLTLLVGRSGRGLLGVSLSKPGQPKPYLARVWRGGKYANKGNFATAEEAALCIARSPEGQAEAEEKAIVDRGIP